MDLYTYIASSNPYQAKAILHKYGYSIKDVRTESDLGSCLKQLVAYEGEDAFNDVLENHPDKNVLLEKSLLEKKQDYKNFDGDKHHCNCGCNDRRYMNFGGDNTNAIKPTNQVGIFIIASALLLATAIIVKK